jgi:hypothetical protein
MRKTNWTPSIVPSDDQTVYLVAEDFGKQGRAWREADYEATDWKTSHLFTLTGQDIKHDIRGMDAVTERFGTGCFHRGQTVSQHSVEDVDHLPLPSSVLASLRRIRSIAAGSTQSLKGAPLRKAPGLRASTGT